MEESKEILIGSLGMNTITQCKLLGLIETNQDAATFSSTTSLGKQFLYKRNHVYYIYPERVGALKILLMTLN